jgi:hypothetical protein
MPEQPSPTEPEILANLHTVANLLREAGHLRPEEQRVVAELVDELARAFESPQVPNSELTKLAESTVQVLKAVHQRHDAGLLAATRTRVDETLMNAEARHPVLVGLVRHLMEALAASGI